VRFSLIAKLVFAGAHWQGLFLHCADLNLFWIRNLSNYQYFTISNLKISKSAISKSQNQQSQNLKISNLKISNLKIALLIFRP